MLTIPWTEDSGWGIAQIKPYGPLSLMPTASVLHYATECFEGMKAYRGQDGNVRLFRPERNAARFLKSATRIALPGFEPEAFLELIKSFVGHEAPKWLSKERDPETSGQWKEKMVYLRPTMIATQAALGVQRPKEALMYVIMVCFPDLDSTKPSVPAQVNGNGVQQKGANGGLRPTAKTGNAQMEGRGMKLLASSADQIRAFPNGWGYAKVGANYGPTLLAQGEARRRGYQQVLWLFGEENYVTEAGGANFFVLWDTAEGKRQLVTAPLDDQIILEGVTRDSVLNLVKEREPTLEVVERRFTMDEMMEASKEGRLVEAFACGTAFFVCPVQEVHSRGTDVLLPLATTQGDGNDGKELSMRVKGWLKDIMYGREENGWGVVIEEQ